LYSLEIPSKSNKFGNLDLINSILWVMLSFCLLCLDFVFILYILTNKSFVRNSFVFIPELGCNPYKLRLIKDYLSLMKFN